MKKFEIQIGSGSWYPYIFEIETEDFQCSQDAWDILVDKLEAEGNEGFFTSWEEIEKEGYYADEYSIGGNHGRIVLHYGQFFIREIF